MLSNYSFATMWVCIVCSTTWSWDAHNWWNIFSYQYLCSAHTITVPKIHISTNYSTIRSFDMWIFKYTKVVFVSALHVTVIGKTQNPEFCVELVKKFYLQINELTLTYVERHHSVVSFLCYDKTWFTTATIPPQSISGIFSLWFPLLLLDLLSVQSSKPRTQTCCCCKKETQTWTCCKRLVLTWPWWAHRSRLPHVSWHTIFDEWLTNLFSLQRLSSVVLCQNERYCCCIVR